MPSDATLTFLFTDIEGSTRRWEASAAMHDRVEEHFRVLRAAVGAAGGEVFATMGDGVAAAFGGAGAAAHAAVAAQLALRATGLPVRMGIHSGEAQRVGDDYRGRSLNRAARIAACAHGGQVLVSETAAALLRSVGSDLALADLGVHHLRDLSAPERLWQLVAPQLPTDFPPLRIGARSALPLRRSSLIGRDVDIETVARLVQEQQLVTLVGMGGVGKTRLAIAAAAAVEDRFDVVHFVDLSAIEDSIGAVDMVAAAVPEIDGARRSLIVVDNCEQVLAGVSSTLERLLRSSEVHVLATSRERLGLEGEHCAPVRPLDIATSAVELFRARVADAGVHLGSEDDETVRDICRRVDALPLAIELAAARVPSLGLHGVGAALEDRADVLRAPRRELGRHSTIVRTIEWSTRLLDGDSRRLFEWMSAFVGGFELDAVDHVARRMEIDGDRVLDIVDSLVAQSLLEVDHTLHGARYRMLWIVRSYAWSALAKSGEQGRAVAAQADWVATICDLPRDEPCSAAVERSALRLEREIDNWRQAVQAALGAEEGRAGLQLDDLARSALIGRLCGPPAPHFLLGRHDLADLVTQLPSRCVRGVDRHAAVCAAATSTAGAGDSSVLQEACRELHRLEEGPPTGLAALLGWIACTWAGQIERGVQLCLDAADDLRVSSDMRDLLLGIATVDRFSLTDSVDRRDELVDRCLVVASRTDVRTHRVACLLGAAWAYLGADDRRSRELCELVLDDLPFVPSFVRQTLPGNISRLLSVLDPPRAASDLAERIARVDPDGATFTDLIPVVHAAALLDRAGHPVARPALHALRSSRVGTYVELLGLSDSGGPAPPIDAASELADVLDDLHAALVAPRHS